MNTSNTALPFFILIGALLTSCGGGGGGSESEAGSSAASPASQATGTVLEATTEAQTPEAPEPEVATPVEVSAAPAQTSITSTEELVVAETFLFKSNYPVVLSVDIDDRYDYLTICYADASDQPDYGNCLLRAELDSGAINRELLLTNDTSRLVVSAWDYADADNPNQSYWDRQTNGDLISLN